MSGGGRKMRRGCAVVTLLVLLGACCAAAAKAQASISAAEMQELTESFNTLFAAMKDGNVAVIEKYCSGGMLTEYRKLLEQNQEYPAFLRKFYKGASFRIASVTPVSDGERVVDVVIQLGDGSKSIARLTAQRSADVPATWKVTRITRDPQTENK
jgi:hypothetical protein